MIDCAYALYCKYVLCRIVISFGNVLMVCLGWWCVHVSFKGKGEVIGMGEKGWGKYAYVLGLGLGLGQFI